MTLNEIDHLVCSFLFLYQDRSQTKIGGNVSLNYEFLTI